ncbi:MAG TPA: LamG domain-containing protein [Flavobacteriales bacterium]|nr:LamG domain-containing protein [Flavobacteriales bacterium]
MSLSNSSNVVGYWRNDGNPSLASTATWTDRSGNGNNGTVYGAPYDLLFKQGYNGSASTSTGRDNQGFPLKQKDVGAVGIHLHGVPAAGSATDPGNTANPVMAPPGQTVISSGEVNVGDAFTLSAWINPTSLGTGQTRFIARKITQNGNWPSYGISVTSTGQLRAEYSTTVYGQCLETYSTAAGLIEQDNWYYVVFLKPAGAPSVNYLSVELYINGVNAAWTNSLYGNHLYSNTVATSTQPTYLGRFIDGSDLTGNWVNLFVGQIGPVHLYSRGLTQAEVTQNFNAQRSRFGI